MSDDALLVDVRNYYEERLRQHGPTARGVDWNSEESQQLRFRELARLWDGEPEASIVDYGCGYGALAAWLRARAHRGAYTGFDVSDAMTAAAADLAASLQNCRFTTNRPALRPADFAVASGVFNVKLGSSNERWHQHVLDGIADLAALGTRGFGFNALTVYSDPDRRRPDLYYSDPVELFDHCKRTYSRYVSLLHDYPLYEFTILVRR